MVGTIIAGLVALAGTIISGAAQNKQIEEAGEKQYGLALIARQDEKEAQAKSYGLKQEELGVVKRKNSFEMQQQKKMMRQQQLLNLGSSLDSLSKKDQNMTNFVLSLYGKNTYNSKGIGA
jgi:hypothetical protein